MERSFTEEMSASTKHLNPLKCLLFFVLRQRKRVNLVQTLFFFSKTTSATFNTFEGRVPSCASNGSEQSRGVDDESSKNHREEPPLCQHCLTVTATVLSLPGADSCVSLDLIDNREADASLKNTSMTHMHLSSVIQYVALCKCVHDETVSPHPNLQQQLSGLTATDDIPVGSYPMMMWVDTWRPVTRA